MSTQESVDITPAPDSIARNERGDIVDSEGRTIGYMAMRLFNDHNSAVEQREYSTEQAKVAKIEMDQTSKAAEIADKAGASDKVFDALLKEHGRKFEANQVSKRQADEADRDRKANLWDSKQHVDENLPAYIQYGKENAARNGVTINTGSEPAPAQESGRSEQ